MYVKHELFKGLKKIARAFDDGDDSGFEEACQKLRVSSGYIHAHEVESDLKELQSNKFLINRFIENVAQLTYVLFEYLNETELNLSHLHIPKNYELHMVQDGKFICVKSGQTLFQRMSDRKTEVFWHI